MKRGLALYGLTVRAYWLGAIVGYSFMFGCALLPFPPTLYIGGVVAALPLAAGARLLSGGKQTLVLPGIRRAIVSSAAFGAVVLLLVLALARTVGELPFAAPLSTFADVFGYPALGSAGRFGFEACWVLAGYGLMSWWSTLSASSTRVFLLQTWLLGVSIAIPLVGMTLPTSVRFWTGPLAACMSMLLFASRLGRPDLRRQLSLGTRPTRAYARSVRFPVLEWGEPTSGLLFETLFRSRRTCRRLAAELFERGPGAWLPVRWFLFWMVGVTVYAFLYPFGAFLAGFILASAAPPVAVRLPHGRRDRRSRAILAVGLLFPAVAILTTLVCLGRAVLRSAGEVLAVALVPTEASRLLGRVLPGVTQEYPLGSAELTILATMLLPPLICGV